MATNLEKKVVLSGASPIKTSSSEQSKNRVFKRKTSKLGSVKVGDVCELKISALGPNNIGMDEFSFPYPVFVPNAKYGSKVQAKMVKIVYEGPLLSGKGLLPSGSVDGSGLLGRFQAGLGDSKQKVETKSYAVAQLIAPSGQSEVKQANVVDTLEKTSVKAGDVLTVSIKKKGSFGIVELENHYRLIVPLSVSLTSYENVKVMVTRTKKEYGFASLVLSENSSGTKGLLSGPEEANQNGKDLGRVQGEDVTSLLPSEASKLTLGSKLTLTLPLNPLAKIYGKYVVLKLENTILFVKLEKGVNLGSKVRIKITSTSCNLVGTLPSAVGRILKINPLSKQQKSALVMKSIREMVSHGMHFGEKAVKCHARMKNYIWFKTAKNGACPLSGGKAAGSLQTEATHVLNGFATEGRGSLAVPTLWSGSPISSVSTSKSVLQTKAPLSKERPLIKKGRNILNLLKTRRCLNQALNKLTKYALKGRTFLFIGTKKPASGLVARASFFTKNSFYVNTRWLGGMLTNWKTICKSISKIRPILKEKQKVVRDILERRQMIKSRLIKKALLLRKKSKLILTKGRSLLEALKKSSVSSTKQSRFSTGNYMTLRNDFVTRGMILLEKRQKFMQKRRELILQTLLLKENGLKISLKHKAILSQLAIYAKKLREYKYLLILTSEIQNLTGGGFSVSNPFSSVEGKETSLLKNLVSVSYSKLKEMSPSSGLPEGNEENQSWIIPNPPKEILNKMVLTMRNQQSALPKVSLGFNNSLISPSLLQTMAGKEAALLPIGGGAFGSGRAIVCSTLLSKFSHFSSYIKSIVKQLIGYIQVLEAQSHSYSTELNQIQITLKTYLCFKQKYVAELQQFKKKLENERSVIRIVKRQLKALDAQKKFIKFLPRLRYLPTPQTKISEIVQILLCKIVDPKFKYPIENIYDQKLSNTSKKLAAARKKKWQRLEKYFGGIANMTKLTKSQISRNVAIIVGQKEEMNAVRECQKLGIKMFTIVDTNCNPTLSDHIIPANDDSRSSIKYILTQFITRIRLAQKLRSRFSLSLSNRRLPARAISN